MIQIQLFRYGTTYFILFVIYVRFIILFGVLVGCMSRHEIKLATHGCMALAALDAVQALQTLSLALTPLQDATDANGTSTLGSSVCVCDDLWMLSQGS